MALTNKERQAAYRARRKQPPNRYVEYLAKEREPWKKGKEAGKKKGAHELNKQEQLKKRQAW